MDAGGREYAAALARGSDMVLSLTLFPSTHLHYRLFLYYCSICRAFYLHCVGVLVRRVSATLHLHLFFPTALDRSFMRGIFCFPLEKGVRWSSAAFTWFLLFVAVFISQASMDSIALRGIGTGFFLLQHLHWRRFHLFHSIFFLPCMEGVYLYLRPSLVLIVVSSLPCFIIDHFSCFVFRARIHFSLSKSQVFRFGVDLNALRL